MKKTRAILRHRGLNGTQNWKWCLTKGWIQEQAVLSSWETEAGWSMELDNIQELIAVTHLETALAELYTSAPLVWRVLMEAVCILVAQTLPKSPQRRTGRGSLKYCLLQRCSYQNEVPRWDSPPLPLDILCLSAESVEKGTKWLGQGLICKQNFCLWTPSAFTPMCVVHRSVQSRRSWTEEQH